MQPYIFPYIGYYQLIDAVDQFIIFDDVNFIKRGWINRNHILLNKNKHLFSIPLSKSSQNKLICDIKVNFPEKERKAFLRTISNAYKRAPYFVDVYTMLEEIIYYEDEDLTSYLHNSLLKTCQYIGIKVNMQRSSKIHYNRLLDAETKIIDICNNLSAVTYINLPGGRDLYNKEIFTKNGMELKYIHSLFDEIKYKQYSNEFIDNLSCIDFMMFNDKDNLSNLIKKYNLTD